MRPEEANMGVITDDLAVSTEGQQGPLQPRTATLLTLPISGHHSVRSVAQGAFKTLWADEPDRAERWRRVGNMDQLFGVGRPLRTINNYVLWAAIQEMEEMGMPDADIERHFQTFGSLMIWADQRDFYEWLEPCEPVA
jgi:hypothetical protein